MILSRRSFLTGLVAAPIIVRAGIIMPVRPIDPRPDITRAFQEMQFVDLALYGQSFTVVGYNANGELVTERLDPQTMQSTKQFVSIRGIWS
jgi:hypothetical protein